MIVWAGLFGGVWPALVGVGGNPFAWHRHEMIFGFLAAALAGFLLTAVPNWTGSSPPARRVLWGLALLWAAERAAVSAVVLRGIRGPVGWLAAVLGPLFYLLLAFWAGRRIVPSGNRNVPVVIAVLLLALADASDIVVWLWPDMAVRGDLGWRTGLALMLVLIGLIGGRITPAFTRNWLAARGDERAGGVVMPNRQDTLLLLATAVGLGLWVARPLGGWTSGALILLGGLHLLRMSRWRGGAARAEPLLLALHVGYAWYAFGFLLIGAAIALAPLEMRNVLHAWTVGAVGTMTLTVMTRAALGHTGRPLVADGWMVAMLLAVSVAALARVTVGLAGTAATAMIHASAVLWALAYLLYLLRLGPVLWTRPSPQ